MSCSETGNRGPASPTLRAVASLPLPLYPGRILGVPSVLDVCDHFAAAEYDVIHLATPGPLGLAFTLRRVDAGHSRSSGPITPSTRPTRGSSRATTCWAISSKLLSREFYRRCSAIAAPSQASARALRERGFGEEIAVLPNGVDGALLTPERRSDDAPSAPWRWPSASALRRTRQPREGSRAGSLPGTASCARAVATSQLVIVGDGPFRAELEAALGETATFTGFLRGEELARTIASCDLFLFPSTTDTLGRAVIEAQACGLPAIVRDAGGAAECLLPGVSGCVIPPRRRPRLLGRGRKRCSTTLPSASVWARRRGSLPRSGRGRQVLGEFVALCRRVASPAGDGSRAPSPRARGRRGLRRRLRA